MLRVLTFSTLYPDATRPEFGCFVERQTLALAARDGVDVEVVAPIGVPPWPLHRHPRYRRFAALPAHETYNGVTVHRPRFPVIPKIGAGWSWRLLAQSVLPLLREIRQRFAFDVIDAEFFYPDGPAAMRLADALGLPYSVKARGADIHHWGAGGASGRAVLEAGRHAGGLLAVSEALKQDMVARGMDEEKIRVHYTGVDHQLFAPGRRATARAKLGIEGPLIASVGALIPRKRHDLAIAALVQVSGARLVIIGEGEEREALAAQAQKLGVEDRIVLLGRQPRESVAEYVAAADVMVLMSTSEGLANAWVEALACGTPVVIADIGGARELVTSDAAGRIVAHDSSAVADAVRALLADPPSPDAVADTVARFSWASNAASLEDHLTRVAGK